jgi:curved DNA-binding protein CbpA
VSVKNYYELLGVGASASADEVKRAFRQQIARYHPDKVQHLGQEFQEMAADRAAELTEAYRILSNVPLRQEYDRNRTSAAPGTPAAPQPPGHNPAPAEAQPEADAAPESPAPSFDAAAAPRAQFTDERATKDVFVKKASLTRFRQALAAIGNSYEDVEVRGFDVACVAKAKLFARVTGPRLLARWVSRVDGAAVTSTWTQAAAATWRASSRDDICVFLIGAAIAPARELADAIAEQRRRPQRGPKLTLIPVDVRDWDARMPTDAPAVAKQLMERLKSGT